MVAAGAEEAFALGYTIVDRDGSDPKGVMALLKRNMRHVDNNKIFSSHSTT